MALWCSWPQEPQIPRIGPILSLLAAALLLSIALNSGLIVAVLEGMGVGPKAARMAGAQLSVVLGMFGAGALLIGLSWLARVGRLRHAWAAHGSLLRDVARPHGAQIQQLPGVGVGFSAEVRGLRLEVILNPDRRGATWVRSQCPAQHPLEIWPLGMSPGTPAPGWERMSAGRSWELWAPVMMDGAEPGITDSLRDALDALFGAGAASRVRHDSGGIEVELPHTRGLDPRVRVPLGIDSVVALARCNH